MQQPHQGMFGPMPGNFPLASVTTEQIQKYLDENKQLILAILDNQNLGKLAECAQYQAQLQKNLLYLAAIADAQPQVPTVRSPTFPSGGMPPYMQQQPQQPMAAFSPRPPTAAMAFNPAQQLHRPQFGAAEARLGFNNGDAAGGAAENREQLLSASSSLSPRQKV